MCKVDNADIAVEVLDCWIEVHGSTPPNEKEASKLVSQLEECSALHPEVFDRFDSLDPEDMTFIVTYIGIALSMSTVDVEPSRQEKEPPA